VSQIFKAVIAVILSGSVTLMMGDGLSIGMATAPGSFRVNNSTVKGSASVLNGMHVGTDEAPSYLVLSGGSQVSLSARSSGQVFKDRLVLEHGAMRIDRADNFSVDTGTVRIIPADPLSKMKILVGDQNNVSVNVLSGEARVTNLKGVEVARVYPGAPLSFSMTGAGSASGPVPQAGAATTTRVGGCVQKVMSGGANYYVLTDSTTNVKIELQGPLAEKLDGKFVEVEGSVNTTVSPAQDASQVIQVAKVYAERKEAGCPAKGNGSSKPVKATGGAGGGGGGVPVWIAGVAIVGVASAATIGGLAAAGTFSSSSGSALAGNSVSTP
jgi:hypothetical protein